MVMYTAASHSSQRIIKELLSSHSTFGFKLITNGVMKAPDLVHLPLEVARVRRQTFNDLWVLNA